MATNAQANCVHEIPRAERIARLNDALRCNGVGGQVLITRGVHALTGSDVTELLKALAAFSDFDADSDPHGERDFGLFDFAGAELIWKIDYYCDRDLTVGSDDPADPQLTHRVLTILLAEEY
jgi:hypothetical protein